MTVQVITASQVADLTTRQPVLGDGRTGYTPLQLSIRLWEQGSAVEHQDGKPYRADLADVEYHSVGCDSRVMREWYPNDSDCEVQ